MKDDRTGGFGTGGFRTRPDRPDRPNRRSIRLKGYDYSQAGAYFITICTRDRVCLFGEIVAGEMRLNDMGRIVETVWKEIPASYPGAAIDAFVVMPNHIHGIILVGAPFMAPHDVATRAGATMAVQGAMNRGAMNRGAMNRAPTVGEIVRGFKARVAIAIHRMPGCGNVAVWQRNYYEHIIRNEESLNRIRQYIADNPLQWALDRENPVVQATHAPPRQEDESWHT
ncbi:MAG: transposase [Methylohalobius sp.]|nr:transposase [Methylohalobius sp.]